MTARRVGWVTSALVGAVALASASTGTVAAEEVTATSMVEVRSPALSYADGALAGAVELSGGCLPDDPVLSVDGDRCSLGATPARGSVAHARLGFDATRTAQGGDTDTPLMHDASGTRRVVTLQLRLREAGDVRVTMRGREADGLSPDVVDGSLVPDGDSDGATATWTLGLLAPGRHEVRVAFDLGPAADGVRFSPEIVIERVVADGVVASHWRGAIPVAEPVATTHRLVLEQRSGGDAPPSLNVPTFATMDHGDALAWSVEPGVTANGRFLPTEQPVQAGDELLVSPEVIAERGLTSMGMAFTAMRPPGAAKDHLTYGTRWPQIGFHYTVASPRPEVDPWTQRPLAALYEGDATQSAVIADASPSDRAGEQRAAAGPAGRLVLAPNGPVTDAVATLAYTHIDGVDSNGVDPESLRSACGDAALMAAVSGEVFTLTADGDVDNSAGTAPLSFQPVQIPHPPGFSRSTVLTLRGGDEEAINAYGLRVTFTDTHTVITPFVPAGKTFLATQTDDGGRRTWVGHPAITIFYSRTRCPVTPNSGRVQAVPAGSVAELTLHAPGRRPARTLVSSGVWFASTTQGHLDVKAAD